MDAHGHLIATAESIVLAEELVNALNERAALLAEIEALKADAVHAREID
jgi:predicted amidohydrolase YtcJ